MMESGGYEITAITAPQGDKMPSSPKMGFLLALGFLVAWPALSQVDRTPEFRGVFNPIVGSGAAYELEGKSGKSDVELTVVGKENVNGKEGVWLEIAVNPTKTPMYIKNLMVIDGNAARSMKMVVQIAGQPPVEITPRTSGQQLPQSSTDAREAAERIGVEEIITSAGTFSCEHYKAKDGRWELWLSPKVVPWGVVKSITNSETMVLTKVISDATDRITGVPGVPSPAPFLPPPPVRGPSRVRVGSEVQSAKIIERVAPKYPADARQAGVQGTVILHAIIGRDGKVSQLAVVSGDALLVDAAMEAVRQWSYKPTLVLGSPVEVDTTISIPFVLSDKP